MNIFYTKRYIVMKLRYRKFAMLPKKGTKQIASFFLREYRVCYKKNDYTIWQNACITDILKQKLNFYEQIYYIHNL